MRVGAALKPAPTRIKMAIKRCSLRCHSEAKPRNLFVLIEKQMLC
jgi:hypothetical protein